MTDLAEIAAVRDILTRILAVGGPGLVLLSAIVLALAPWVDWCMYLTVNWRRMSLGLISFAICFPCVRRHLLRRYKRSLSLSERFSGWLSDGRPLFPKGLDEELAKHRQIVIAGSPGAVTSCLMHMAWCYATNKASIETLQKTAPIYVNLRPVGETVADIERRVATQLSSYGDITDEKLANSFLKLGGFTLILDGLGELDSPSLEEARVFMNAHGNKNFIVMGYSGVIPAPRTFLHPPAYLDMVA